MAATEAALAYIGLGANLGDARASLEAAISEIAALDATQVVARSSFYRSAPIDATGPDFINAVIAISTRLLPLELLTALQAIELEHGRQRPYRNAPRTLDLDVLLYGDLTLRSARLELPHPRLAQRAFVLLPLAEIAPALDLPGHGPIGSLLPAVADQAISRVA